MIAVVRRSVAVVTFISLLGVALHSPQVAHVQRLADLLVVAPGRKTLAQLASLELLGVDASNIADFFRISPWDPDDLRLPLVDFVLRFLAERIADPSLPVPPVYFSIDDSLVPKDKATTKLESIDWLFDHNLKKTIRAGNHVVLRIHWGDFSFPLLWRLYLRETTVRRLNRRRKKHNKLRYRSKLELAQEMLQQVLPKLQQIFNSLSKKPPVYVLFDSWYTSAKLVKWIRQQCWHVIAGIKSNRKLSHSKLTDWHRQFKGRPYERVSLGLANGKVRPYWVRTANGCGSSIRAK